MHWFDGLRLKLRKRWDRVDAVLVDSRFVERKVEGGDNPHSWEIWEYMVDVPPRDGGEAVRMTFQERRYRVREVKRKSTVPVVVNAKRTKAMFNLADIRIDQDGWATQQAAERKARDDARFEANRKRS